MIRSLKGLQIIGRKGHQYCFAGDFLEMAIPATLQDVIMARVDALPEGAREVLQAGSAIEREFSHKLIKGVTGLSEQELLARLSILKDAELLFDRGIYPDSTYIFKHNLTRDVVYDSILSVKKKKLHEAIGNMIEVLYRDTEGPRSGPSMRDFGQTLQRSQFENSGKFQRTRNRVSVRFFC